MFLASFWSYLILMMRNKFCIVVKLCGLILHLHFCIAMQWKWQANQVFGIKVHKGKESRYSNVEMETIAFFYCTLHVRQMTKVSFMLM